MNIIIAPDSFKGTLSAAQVCNSLQKAFQGAAANSTKTISVKSMPIADGGEGTLAALESSIKATRISINALDALKRRITASYLLTEDNTAIIEAAEVIGLGLVGDNKNPMETTTYGVGELIKSALDKNAKHIIIGIGGSATNDGGIGMAAALGIKCYDTEGYNFIPVGGNLEKIDNIDFEMLDKRIRDTKFTIMSDVNNVICGEFGATYTYARQKGAREEELAFMDAGMLNLVNKVQQACGKSYLKLCGGGAAGGLGMGCKAFLNGNLKRGIDMVLDIIQCDSALKDADLIISGEGKLDSQSLMGKAVYGMGKRATKAQIPFWVVCGKNELSPEELAKLNVNKVYECNPHNLPFSEVQKSASDMLDKVAKIVAKDALLLQ